MNEVNNPKQFVNELKNCLNNDSSVQKILQWQTLGQVTGKNSLGSRRF